MTRSLLALLALAGLVALACQEASEPQFTPQPATTFEPRPGPPIVNDGSRPANAGDGGPDAAADGEAPDGGADGGDAAPVPVDAAPDARPDASTERQCRNDGDCVLAVRLETCEPCPIAAHVDAVLAERCLAVYVEGATIGAYAPADCWAGCGDAIGEACFDAPAAPVCEPPGQAGECVLFR